MTTDHRRPEARAAQVVLLDDADFPREIVERVLQEVLGSGDDRAHSLVTAQENGLQIETDKPFELGLQRTASQCNILALLLSMRNPGHQDNCLLLALGEIATVLLSRRCVEGGQPAVLGLFLKR
jgi:hypothetical protein